MTPILFHIRHGDIIDDYTWQQCLKIYESFIRSDVKWYSAGEPKSGVLKENREEALSRYLQMFDAIAHAKKTSQQEEDWYELKACHHFSDEPVKRVRKSRAYRKLKAITLHLFSSLDLKVNLIDIDKIEETIANRTMQEAFLYKKYTITKPELNELLFNEINYSKCHLYEKMREKGASE